MDPESVSVPRNACLSFLTWDVGNVDRACETPRRQASSNERTPFTMAAALLGKTVWLTAEHPHQSGALRGSRQERACPPASWPQTQRQLTWGCSRLSVAGGGFGQPVGGPSPPAGPGPGPSHAQLCTAVLSAVRGPVCSTQTAVHRQTRWPGQSVPLNQPCSG